MALMPYTSRSVPVSDKALNGGLNSTAGPLGLANNESSDLLNIDFNKFGSIVKRNGYTQLNSTPTTGSNLQSDGLWWYEYNNAGTTTRHLINIAGGTFHKMDDLDGTWDDITGTVTITNANACDFTNFLNRVYITNGQNQPFQWSGSANAIVSSTFSGLTTAKYNEAYNNYLFYANCVVSGTYHNSRVYWSAIKDTTSWNAADFIDINKDDGQYITRIKTLGDRLVIFKTRSIYNLFFTGDADIPFILPGGGKSNSSVGCIAPFSVQEVNNGLVFLSHDGFYFYDGLNSYKISDRVTTTILGYANNRFDKTISLNQYTKNRYWAAFTTSGATQHNRILVWDYFNNAWSIYSGTGANSGLNPSSMVTTYVDGTDERPYFADYTGYTYRGDTGSDDYPLGTQTAINAYYYTNWKTYDDLVDQKGIPHVTIYYQNSNSVLSFGYSYDFETTDQYTQTFSLSAGSSTYGASSYGTATYSGSGGDVVRRDLTGRGRVVRFKFANNITSETFQVDGFGSYAHLETQV